MPCPKNTLKIFFPLRHPWTCTEGPSMQSLLIIKPCNLPFIAKHHKLNKGINMKKNILFCTYIIAIFCLSLPAHAQQIYDANDVLCDENAFCTDVISGLPITGIIKTYYESGALQSETTVKNGKSDGPAKAYYESGILMVEGNFEDGIGTVTQYYESGIVEKETRFKDGKRNGLQKLYDQSGNLESEKYFKDGKKNGSVKEYYPSGKLMTQANYKDDNLDGLAQLYYESGALNREVNFKDGKKDGVMRTYVENGDIILEERFENGVPVVNVHYDIDSFMEDTSDIPVKALYTKNK